MVRTGKDRSEKYSEKFDPYVLMLRSKKRFQTANETFDAAAFQHYILDKNIVQWLSEVSLKFGEKGTLYDFAKFVISRWEILDPIAKEVLHQKWLSKGLTQELWDKILAKRIEINQLYSFCGRPESRLMTNVSVFLEPYSLAGDEQIVNGGFETGDLTSWDSIGTVGVDTGSVHSGSYACYLYKSNGIASIEQELAVPVPSEDITTFGIWLIMIAGNTKFDVTITYSDSTFTSVQLTELEATYKYFDLLPYLEAEKSVSKVKFAITSDDVLSAIKWIDDVSLMS